MKPTEATPYNLEQFLQVYKREPAGSFLYGKLRLPLSIVYGLFVFVYFGVLLALHTILKTPHPANIGEVFQYPSTTYYYPNILGIAYDVIGNPIQFVLLILFREYIPAQFITLRRDNIIELKPKTSGKFELLRWFCQNNRAHILMVVVIPLLNAIWGIFVDIQQFGLTGGIPGMYGVFLSFLGRYARVSVIVQIIYVFLILGLHTINPKFNIRHPDGCNGFAPFGNLSLIIYFFLFIFALTEAVVTAIGIVSGNASSNVISIYLWIIFPITTLFVFERLVYQPHKILSNAQKQHLLDSSRKWNDYYSEVISEMEKQIGDKNKGAVKLSGELQTLDNWKKLDAHISDIHTWPISRHSLRILSTLTNPLIPILLPAITELTKNLIP